MRAILISHGVSTPEQREIETDGKLHLSCEKIVREWVRTNE